MTFANPPGGKFIPNKFTTHDYFDELVAYKDFPDPSYGSSTQYSLQDGEMIYHIKQKSEDSAKNTAFAIGLVVKDAVYDGNGKIADAVKIAVGSYESGTFSPAQDSTQTFDLNIAEKGQSYAYINPNTGVTATIDDKGTRGTICYIGNISPDQPEFLYESVTFNLTYPVGAELEIGFGDTFSTTDQTLGAMMVGEAIQNGDGKTQTTQVTVSKGWKKATSNAVCSVRLNFNENAGFKPGETHALTLSNVQVTTGTSSKAITIRDDWDKLSYTLSPGGQDETSLSSNHRTAYNHTIDAAPGSYLVPLGNANITNGSASRPTPYDKTFEAQYNVTNTAANVSYITVPVGTNSSPVIEWSGIAADGTLKTGTITDPTPYGNNAGGIGNSTLILLPAADFGIVSFTGVKVEIGALSAGYKSADTAPSWLITKDNLSSAYGYFTTDEPGIQVINNYRLYNTEPALRDRQNGDLSATATGTSSDLCRIGWNGIPKLDNKVLTTEGTQVSIDAGDVAKLNGSLYPYTSPSNARVSNGDRGTATLVMDPIIYLTLPQGMTVVEKDLKFELEEQDFRLKKSRVLLKHQIENVSYLNTTGDGVSIYKITFPKGTRFGYFDENAIQTNLYYNIPLLTSKSLETRRYSLSELICVTAENQPEATKYYGANSGLINYVIADKYGINGGRALGTLSKEKDDADGKLISIGFGVQQSSEINLYSSVAVTKIGGQPTSENRWYSYSSDPNSIALLGQNSEGRLRLQVSNTSATEGSDLRIILPIPQKDADLGDAFMDDKSGFTMSMTYDSANSNKKFTAKYIQTTGTYDTIEDNTNIVNYNECLQQEANAVMFTANSVEQGEYYIYLDFTVTNGTPESIDIWRPVYAYTVKGNRNDSRGSYVASEVAASSISGVAFADVNRNGVQDTGEDGAADVTVVAKDAQNRIVSTKTAQDGSYHFLAIRESTIDMSFALSAEGQKTLRFNVPALPDGTTGITSTVTPSPDGLTATKTFVAAAGEEKVHAAVDGFVSLSYGANGATGNLPKTGSHVKGTSVTVAVKPDNLAKKGYTFQSWNTNADGSGTTYQPGAKITVSQNTTLYAIWELASYTITFNYRGATGGNDEASRVLSHNDTYGKYQKLPTPTKNGYDFGGWNADTTKPTSTVTDKTKFTLGADTTLYALWTPKTMKVTYDVNGGSGSIAEKTVSWEAGVLPINVEATGITKNGFTLSGWTYNGTLVTETDTYGGLAVSDATASITLTAQWQAKGDYTVKYNTQGGSTIDDKTGVTWTDTHLLPPNNPTKTGNAFVGWKLDTTDVSDSSSYGSLATVDTKKEITLTAQWTEITGNVVSYDTDGGSPVNDMVNVEADATNLLPTSNPTKSGYTLDKWVVLGTQEEVTSATKYSDISNNANAVILKAIWKAKSYTVKYTTGGGTAVLDKTDVKWADAGLLPTQSPTLTGYIFDGWYYNGTKVTATTELSVLIPQDNAPNNTITLTAKWTERTYTVEYNSDGGGNFTPKANVKFTATGLLPDVQPVRLGYTFKGWFVNGSVDDKEVKSDTTCGSLLVNDTAKGVLLTAKWDVKTGFTVQYDINGGTQVAPTSKTVAWNDINLLPTTPTTKNGYTFTGWLSGRTDVTIVTAFSALATNDKPGTSVTLVAQWKEKDNYTVTYDTDGGSRVADKTGVAWTDAGLIPPTKPTKAGQQFVKWQFVNGPLGTKDVSETDTYGALVVTDTVTKIELTAVWTLKDSYIVTYDTDGGSAVTAKTGVKWTDANLLPTDVPTKTGYTFVKWQLGARDVSETDTYGALAVTDTVTKIELKAVWTKDASAPSDISGTVKDANGSPVANALVRLTQGSTTIYGPTTTNALGEYRLSNLQPGIYNLVAEKEGQTVTAIVTVADRSLEKNLILPTEKKNSVLVVEGADTPDIVVGNLDEIAENTHLETGSTSLTIRLTVQKEAERTSGKETEHQAIRTTAGTDAEILFLDALLTKQVNSNPPTDIGKNNDVVLEMVIPFDLTGNKNVSVYRYHDSVNAFQQLFSRPDGTRKDQTYYLDERAGLIHVYAEKYSTYAISYRTGGSGEDPGGGGGGGGGNSGGGDSGGGDEEPGGGGSVIPPKPEKDPSPQLPTETGAAQWLNWESHFAYIVGRSDGLLHPADSITRGEVATIFYRLLRDDMRIRYETTENPFSDVPPDAWYHRAVSTLSNAGIISGRPDGTFAPDMPITRAEFAAITARFSSDAYEGSDLFADIGGHWASAEINRSASYGWVNGIGGGTFYPDRSITRVEAVTLINRVLCRLPKDADALLPEMKTWPDNRDASKWYYLAFQEATNGHSFRRTEDGTTEEWTSLFD